MCKHVYVDSFDSYFALDLPLKEQLNQHFEQLSSLVATKCGTFMASTSKRSSKPIPFSPVELISHDEQGDNASERRH